MTHPVDPDIGEENETGCDAGATADGTGCDTRRAAEVDGGLQEVDVVVVGAGIAGLAAARSLLDAGYSVRVLEGRDRIGGRLLSQTSGDGTGLDLGATWFWPGEPRVQQLIVELGIAVFSQYLEGDALYHQPPEQQSASSPAKSSSAAYSPPGHAGPGGLRLDGNPLDVPSGRFALGAISLARAVADRLDPEVIAVGQGVESVHQDDDHMVVRTATAQHRARHVILAVPPALAVADIDFEPPLPERLAGLAAITPVWMGATIKVVVHYHRPFWRDDGLSGSGISHLGPMRELHDMSGPDGSPAAVFGFVPALAADQPPPERTAIIEQMVELFGPQAARPEQVLIQDWRRERWTSPQGVERLNAYQTYGHGHYQQPAMGGRLHWASTETSTVNPGHIEGALAAAERAVAAIVSQPPNGNEPFDRQPVREKPLRLEQQ